MCVEPRIMPTYFKPLRRKLGVLMLLMACVLMAGWVRSLRMVDLVVFGGGAAPTKSLRSVDGTIEWHDDRWVGGNMRELLRWQSMALRQYQFVWMVEKGTAALDVNLSHRIEDSASPESVLIINTVPYWSIVIPLILLSAWRLLSKPKPPATGPKNSQELAP